MIFCIEKRRRKKEEKEKTFFNKIKKDFSVDLLFSVIYGRGEKMNF